MLASCWSHTVPWKCWSRVCGLLSTGQATRGKCTHTHTIVLVEVYSGQGNAVCKFAEHSPPHWRVHYGTVGLLIWVIHNHCNTLLVHECILPISAYLLLVAGLSMLLVKHIFNLSHMEIVKGIHVLSLRASSITTPQDAHKRWVLQVYLGSNTLEFSAIRR